MKFFVLTSFLIHFVLIGLLDQLNVAESTSQPQVLTVQLTQIKEKKQTSNASGSKKSRFFGLSSKLRYKSAFQPSSRGDQLKETSAWLDKQSYQGDELSKFEGVSTKQSLFLKTVWTEINDFIPEHPFLTEYGIIGTVSLSFEVDENGFLIPDSLSAQTDQQILKVLAARSVRKSLKADNLDLVQPDKKTKLFARFEWTDQISCDQHQGINKNYLGFCRKSKGQRKTFTKTEKAAAYLSALQYGPEMFDVIKKYNQQENRKDTKFDPFEEIKRDPDWNLGS